MSGPSALRWGQTYIKIFSHTTPPIDILLLELYNSVVPSLINGGDQHSIRILSRRFLRDRLFLNTAVWQDGFPL